MALREIWGGDLGTPYLIIDTANIKNSKGKDNNFSRESGRGFSRINYKKLIREWRGSQWLSIL